MGDGVGLGNSTGVGVGEGDCVPEPGVVVNVGSAPVPRTQASGGVQGLLGEMLEPSALQELLAAFTMAMRRPFNPLCKEVVP